MKRRFIETIPGVFIILTIITILGAVAYIYKGDIVSRRKISGIEDAATDIGSITPPEGVRVFSLGEATHGNKEFQELKLSLFKKMVEEKDYKVFGMEECFGPGLKVNEYINGKLTGVTAEDMVKEMGCPIYHTETIAEVIDYMKDYNEKVSPEDRLYFFGFDMQGIYDYEAEYLENVITKYTDEERLEKLSGCVESVKYLADNDSEVTKDNKESLAANYDILRAFLDEKISEVELDYAEGEPKRPLSDNRLYELNMAMHIVDMADILLDYYDMDIPFGDRYDLRDKTMAENVQWFDDLLKEEDKCGILVTAHNGHVCEMRQGDEEGVGLTFGRNLRDIFGDALYTVGTEYYLSVDNINDHSHYSYEYTRRNHKFCSADPVAYQAKDYNMGSFFIDFEKVDRNSELYDIISSYNYMGSAGEGYIPDNDFCHDNQRAYVKANELYDGVVYYYMVNPIEVID